MTGWLLLFVFLACCASLVSWGIRRNAHRRWALAHSGYAALDSGDEDGDSEGADDADPLEEVEEQRSITYPVVQPSGQLVRNQQPVSSTVATPSPVRSHAAWWPVVQTIPDQVPHVAILGPSGQGKSTLMEALAKTREGQCIVIQPNRKKDEWPGVPVVECDDNGGYTAIAAALAQIRAEFTARGGRMKHGDPGPWLHIVWDEVPLTIGKLGKFAKEMMVDLLSAGRPRKIRLIAGSTSDRVGALGIEGYGDLLDSCAVLRIGGFAVAEVPELERVEWPTSLTIQRRTVGVERGPVRELARTLVDAGHWWMPTVDADRLLQQALETPVAPAENSEGVESVSPASQSVSTVSVSTDLVAEIAHFTASIQAGKGKTETLKSVPTGYSGREHKRLSDLYEQVRATVSVAAAT